MIKLQSRDGEASVSFFLDFQGSFSRSNFNLRNLGAPRSLQELSLSSKIHSRPGGTFEPFILLPDHSVPLSESIYSKQLE